MGLCFFKSEDNCVSLPHDYKNTVCPCAALSNRELIRNDCVIVFNFETHRRCNFILCCFLWPLFFYGSFGTVVKRNISSCPTLTHKSAQRAGNTKLCQCLYKSYCCSHFLCWCFYCVQYVGLGWVFLWKKRLWRKSV